MFLSVMITLYGFWSIFFYYIYTNQTYIIRNWQIFLIGFFYGSLFFINWYILDTYPLFNCSNYYGHTFFVGKILENYCYFFIMTYYACNLQNNRIRMYKLLVLYRDSPLALYTANTTQPNIPKEGVLIFFFAWGCSELFFYIYCYFFNLNYIFIFFFPFLF